MKKLEASIYQKNFYLEWKLDPESIKYNVFLKFELHGQLSTPALKQAIINFINYSENQRTFFVEENEEIKQVIADKINNIDFGFHDLTDMRNQNAKITAILHNIHHHIFNLQQCPLYRFDLIKTGQQKYIFTVNWHHIISDAEFLEQFVEYISNEYNAIVSNNVFNHPCICTAEEYIQFEKNNYQSSDLKEDIDFWKQELSETDLSVHFSDMRFTEKEEEEQQYFTLDRDLSDKLQQTIKENNTTLFLLLLSAFSLLIQRYTNQTQIVLRFPVNMRPKAFKRLLGVFVNTTLIKIDINPNMTIKKYISTVYQQRTRSKPHQRIPLFNIVSGLRFEQKYVENAFNAAIGETILELTQLKLKDCRCTAIIRELQRLDDLGCYFQVKEQIYLAFDHNGKYFDSASTHEIYENFKIILHQFAEYPDRLLQDVQIVTTKRRSQLLFDWNNTNVAYPKNKTLQQLFEEAVAKAPDNIAVVFEGQQMTFGELNQKSNQLAYFIREQYILKHKKSLPPNTLIGLCVEKSADLVIGILGILKAGAAYVPLDPDYPKERLEYMIADSRLHFIVTQQRVLEQNTYLSTLHPNALLILDDKIVNAHLEKNSMDNPVAISRPQDLAYVIYTSGSTGRPKGVMIEHQSACHLAYVQKDFFNCNENTRSLQFSSICFDAAVSEIFVSLISRSSLYIIPNETKQDANKLIPYLINNKINLVTLPPPLLAVFPDTSLPALETLVIAGEKAEKQIMDRWSEGRIFINAYGPTEYTVCASMHVYKKEDRATNIGKPNPNTQFYVLDSHYNLVPVGVPGELYIGGMGLARGYLNQKKLTKEKFISNPFAKEISLPLNDKIYKTGDLVRWLPDGNIEYVGRTDFQVKIRGFRIELGEIEAVLSHHWSIRQNAVIAFNEEGHKYLVAYYVVAENQEPPSFADLRGYLAEKLPDYMLPSAFVKLDAIPLTRNGKLNRDALPKPDLTSTGENYVAPQTDVEVALCQIWQELLGLEKVGIRDDFFRLGGDSILSIKLTSRMRTQGLIGCSIKDIFEQRTIACLARYMQTVKTTMLAPEEGRLTGTFDLIPIQIWFFQQNFKQQNHWNQAFLIKVPELDPKKLTEVIQQLAAQHDVLRITYLKSQKKWRQQYHAHIAILALKILDRTTIFDKELQGILTNWQNQFDIERGPLWQIGYIHGYADGSARIFIAMHHLIIDTVSWRILIEDIQTLYESKELSPKTNSYRQWVTAVQTYAKKHESEITYWKEEISDQIDYPQSEQATLKVRNIHLDEEETQQLLHLANQAYHTEINHLLLAALAMALKIWHQSNRSYITLEGHGREAIDESLDVSRTLGWFTTAYPVKLELHKDLSSSINAIKEHLRAIPNNGIGYSALKYYLANDDLRNHKLPKVSFNYLGQFDRNAKRFWQLTNEPAGINMPENVDNIINIIGFVLNGRLQFKIACSLDLTTTERFVEALQKSLETVITHCVKQASLQKMVYLPSDFFTVETENDLSHIPLIANQDAYQESFDMSEIQKAYLIGRLDIFEIGNVANHVYQELYFRDLNVVRLEMALNKLIEAFPEMRTVFDTATLQQKYLPYDQNTSYTIKIIEYDERFSESSIEFIRKDRSHKVYNVSQYPLFDFQVSKFKDVSILHVNIDLILLDAESRASLFDYLKRLYEDLNFTIDKPKITFRDYQSYITLLKLSKWYQRDKKYWASKLDTLPLRPSLPLKCSPENIKTPRFSMSNRQIKQEIWLKFKNQANKNNVSYSSALLALYGLVISYWSDDPSLLITMTLFNRYQIHPEVNKLWGDFTATSLFGFHRQGKTINDFIQSIHTNMWDDIDHRLYSGMEVQRDLLTLRQLDPKQAVSSIVFTSQVSGYHENAEENTFINDSEIIEKRYFSVQTSQAWIDLQAIEKEGGFTSGWLYVTQLFDEKFIDYLNEQYCKLIEYLALSDWNSPIPTLLPAADHQLIEYANIAKQNKQSTTLLTDFELQVRNRGNKVAVIDSKGTCSYAELSKHVDNLSRHLIESGAQKNKLMAVLCEKGRWQAVALLGILKARAPYVPLQVDWPLGRIQEILIEAKVKHLLVSTIQWEKIKHTSIARDYEIIILEKTAELIHTSEFNAFPTITANDLAYVIFTSGSTGKPKGVMISHAGAINTLQAINERFNINKNDKILALSELCFDLSVYDLFGLLARGGTIIYPEQAKTKDPKYWYELITKHNITIWNTVPQLMQLLVNYVKESAQILDSLRLVLMSGDWIPLKLPEKINKLNPNINVMSLGGTTETSIWSVWYEIKEVESHWTSIPYGVAMPNQKIYNLNEFGEHCPVGILGDIYIGGEGVALGYWHDPDKTAASFIRHPTLGRLFKTGDLGRWNHLGYLEFEGRKDHQVKLNGYRVELEEIFARLIQIPDIDDAVVLLQDNQIIAYIVTDKFDVKKYKKFLIQYLPEYMLPREYFKLKKLPLTATGKIDYGVLPKIENRQNKFVPPRTELETDICKIWQELLEIPRVGIQDDFFHLGGNSILAIQLVHRIKQAFDTQISVADIFQQKTISDLVTVIKETTSIVIPVSTRKKPELSFAQQRLWFIEQYERGTTVYHIPMLFELVENVDQSALQQALRAVVNRHAVLRSVIREDVAGQNYQHILNEDLPIQSYQLKDEIFYHTQLAKDINTVFDLVSEYPMRVCLYEVESNGQIYLLIKVHHIAFDGWSQDILFKELEAFYGFYTKDIALKLPSLVIQYKDYAEWQRNYLQGEILDEQLQYWHNKLQQYEPVLLPLDKIRPKQINYQGGEIVFTLSLELSKQLRKLAKREECSLYTLLLTGFYLLIYKYTGQSDLVLGTPVANRDHAEVKDLIGFFVNSVVLREQININKDIQFFLQQVKTSLIETQRYQDFPFEQLVQLLVKERDTSRHPIFQILFCVQSFGNQSSLLENKLHAIAIEEKFITAKFDLSLYIDDSQTALLGKFNYAVSLFEAQTIERIAKHFEIILDAMVTNVKQKIKKLSLLSPTEYQEIIYNWNLPQQEYPQDKTVQELFEAQVQKTPNNLAVIFEDNALTYQELNQKANQLAHFIRDQYYKRNKKSLSPDTLIGLCVEKSFAMMIGILGIVKAGAAYVPLDPNYPKDRLEFMIDDCQAEWIVTQKKCIEQDSFLNKLSHSELIILDDETIENKLNQCSKANPIHINVPKDLAYVIYTSGSTGKPKGVLQPHCNIMRLFTATDAQFNFNQNDTWVLFHSYAFDFSVWEMWGALFYGGKLMILNNVQTNDLEQLYQLCVDKCVTVLNLTPSVFYLFADKAVQHEPITHLRYVIFGGEALNNDQLRPWWHYANANHIKTKLINMYGITETTVHVTYKELSSEETIKSNIGKPLADLKAYVLDTNYNPVPMGIVGELYVGGAGLARGYLNRSELTQERFIKNPLANPSLTEMDRIYKTGDLVRRHPNGDFEYIGRTDFQVKIRGFRIEVGEIEKTLLQHKSIRQNIVIARGDNGHQYLAAYYVVAKDQVEPTKEMLTTHLAKSLPDYMIPAAFVKLDNLPLTSNGKINRNALPNVEFVSSDYVAPNDELEGNICAIYAEILGLAGEKVGVRDDFFQLGGDSILAIRLVAKLNKYFNCDIRVSDIFEFKKIENIINKIRQEYLKDHLDENQPYQEFSLLNQSLLKHFDRRVVEDAYPACYLQSGMLLESSRRQDGTYHDVFSYNIQRKFNRERFLSIWNQLISKHALLRCKFVLLDNGWNLVVMKNRKATCRIVIEADSNQLIEAERMHEFDFAKPGLFRLIVNRFNDHFNFIFSFHHAITDGWSVASLINEFIQAYQFDSGVEDNIPVISYGEFVQKEQYALKNAEQINFWKTYLIDYVPMQVKWKFNQSISKSGLFSSIHRLEPNYVTKLLKLKYDHAISIDSVFLNAYLLTLAQFTSRNDIVIGLVMNNRLEKEGGDRLFGLFLNTLPARFKIDSMLDSTAIFKEKVKLYNYKNIPYGFIKSLMGFDVYQFYFNFIHFHTLSADIDQIFDPNSFEKTNIPFLLNISQVESDRFTLSLVAHDDFIDPAYLDYFKEYLIFNLRSILDGTTHEFKLTNADYQKIINTWNQTEALYPQDKTIYQLFEEQVKKFPNNIAVLFKDQTLTYQELNTKSNQLAYLIREQYRNSHRHALPADMLIGLCVERSFDMIIGILGILKAGAAYVPLDPDYPKDRLEYMISDSHAELIVTQQNIIRKNKFLNRHKLIIIDSPAIKTQLTHHQIINPSYIAGPKNLAYVIYTSGSTGKPKGVMIEHRAVVNHNHWMQQTFGFTDQDRILQKTPFSFDASVWELLLPITHGAQLVFAEPNKHKDPEYYLEVMEKFAITKIQFVPSLLRALIDFIAAQNINLTTFHSLKDIFCGGEPLSSDLAGEVLNLLPIKLHNLYGPSETTIDTSYFSCQSLAEIAAIPIGKPIYNMQLYVLDSHFNPCPIGVPGEIYIGGVGVARGYLNQTQLTEERFIENPFARDRMYKSGDLARWLPDGNLEYIGRTDFQIKIRGFRIELGEIEHALSQYKSIKQNAVIALDNSDRISLAAYYVVIDGEAEPKMTDLTSHLAKIIPEYMIPTVFMKLDTLPLTPNGKINRQALPKPELISNFTQYTPPRTSTENQLCIIWEKLLGIENISITDNFFSIGGDSILSIQLISKMRDKGFDCKIIDIFKYPTIEKLSAHLKTEPRSVFIEAEQGLLEGTFDLLPIQKWFFEQTFSQYNHWNQSFLVKVPELSVEKLQDVLIHLVNQHDMLRVNYHMQDNSMRQQYWQQIPIPNIKTLDVSNLTKKNITEILTIWQSEFNIEDRPLWQMGYLHGYRDGSARIFFALHHLIVDTVSWRILIEDIKKLYAGKSLGHKTSSYRQWVNALQSYAKEHLDDIDYWHLQNKNTYQNVKIDCFYSNSITFDETTTKQLIQQANNAHHTEINDLLLTALAYTLAEWQGYSQNAITFEGHGRELIHDKIDLSATVGWFTTVYPITLEIKNDISNSIKCIKENLRLIPHKGIGFGALKYYSKTNLLTNSLPPVSFNYLGQFDSSQEMWQVVNENSGISIPAVNLSDNLIDITGMVMQGKLQFRIETKLGKRTTQELAKNLQGQLIKVIKHCLLTIKNKKIEYTFSDFKNYEPYIQLNKSNNKSNPIFIFPPGDGGAESYYHNIVPKLSAFNLILFNNFYLHLSNSVGEKAIDHLSLENLASQYLLHIKKLQPKGPYNFMGWSFGGLLATEIARQLIANGDHINNIVIIDSYFNFQHAVKNIYVSNISRTLRSNINYKYVINPFKLDGNILLFKASKEDSIREIFSGKDETEAAELKTINYYYVNETRDNHITQFIKEARVDIIALKSSHRGWTRCDEDIALIANMVSERYGNPGGNHS